MNKLSVRCLLLLTVCNLANSRVITEDVMISVTESCEATYGILPCSSNAWGLLFLIVVYEILLSLGGKYVGMGSEMFFTITGPGIVGGSLFQFLGTIPQIVLVLGQSFHHFILCFLLLLSEFLFHSYSLYLFFIFFFDEMNARNRPVHFIRGKFLVK